MVENLSGGHMEPLKGAGAAPHDQSKAPGLGRKKKFFAPVFVASVAIALVLVIGTVLTYTARAANVDSSDAPHLNVPVSRQHDNEFARVAKTVEPAVVNVNTESTIKNPHRGMRVPPHQGPGEGDSMQDWFDRFFGQGPQGGESGPP